MIFHPLKRLSGHSLSKTLSLRPAVAATCLILLTSFGCGSAFQNINFLTDADEIAIGREFSKEIEREIELYTDPEVVRYVDELGQTLVRHSKTIEYPILHKSRGYG